MVSIVVIRSIFLASSFYSVNV